MCSFCFHGFEMVTVIERDGDRRQVEHIQMPGKDFGGGGAQSFRLWQTHHGRG